NGHRLCVPHHPRPMSIVFKQNAVFHAKRAEYAPAVHQTHLPGGKTLLRMGQNLIFVKIKSMHSSSIVKPLSLERNSLSPTLEPPLAAAGDPAPCPFPILLLGGHQPRPLNEPQCPCSTNSPLTMKWPRASRPPSFSEAALKRRKRSPAALACR